MGDVDIPGSPFTVQVKKWGTPLRTIGGLNNPWGVAVGMDGCVVVTENRGNRVMLLNKNGNAWKSFDFRGGKDQKLSAAKGVVVTQDNEIIVSDDHRIQKFDMEGKLLSVVDSRGSGQLQFHCPDGIAIDKNGKIFVPDRYNHRIQVLNPNFTLSNTFEFQGLQLKQFPKPCCIAIDSEGMIYVIDKGNHRVQKFTFDGEFVSQFGEKGCKEGELMCPRGITVDTATDTVYVSSEHKVSVFTNDGDFLKECGQWGSGEEDFKSPTGLAVEESTGNLYVCDSHNGRLVIY